MTTDLQFTGHRSEAIPYFSSIGHPMPSEFFNPADHLLDLVSVDPRSSQYDNSLERVNGLTAQWRTKQHKESGEEHVVSNEAVKRGEGTTSMRIAFPVVLERTWKNLWRKKDVRPPGLFELISRHSSIDYYNPPYSVDCLSCFSSDSARALLVSSLSLLIIEVCDRADEPGAQDRIGITIESTTAIPFVGLLNAAAIFPGDRNLYFHEIKSSARYSPATFMIVYSLVGLWAELLGSFAYAAIVCLLHQPCAELMYR